MNTKNSLIWFGLRRERTRTLELIQPIPKLCIQKTIQFEIIVCLSTSHAIHILRSIQEQRRAQHTADKQHGT